MKILHVHGLKECENGLEAHVWNFNVVLKLCFCS